MRRIQAAAVVIREGKGPTAPHTMLNAAPGLTPLFKDPGAEVQKVREFVAGARTANKKAAISANFFSGSSPAITQPLQPAPPPALSPGAPRAVRYRGYTCIEQRGAWTALFPGACQHWAITGLCKFHTQGTCQLKHDPISQSAVDAHVLAVSGRIEYSVDMTTLIKDG